MERHGWRFFRYDLCMELIFEVREAEEGGYVARALGQPIFTEAETWQELRDNVLEVTSLHFEDAAESPKLIQLHFVKDELIAVQAALKLPRGVSGTCGGAGGLRLGERTGTVFHPSPEKSEGWCTRQYFILREVRRAGRSNYESEDIPHTFG